MNQQCAYFIASAVISTAMSFAKEAMEMADKGNQTNKTEV